jgi:hypothetical protein
MLSVPAPPDRVDDFIARSTAGSSTLLNQLSFWCRWVPAMVDRQG